ncbi:hypothetical protein Csa_008644 [Cucumis sativus]|nr:hypothetical protein Csa_008644 [Cucumis sativus]
MRSQFQIIRIPGDGRCLFRSVVYGACLRSGKLAPSEVLQKELADELRENVANELMKRRLDTERFIEGDFGQYVRHMRQPHVWGGEPELLMSSHVLHSSRILRPRVFCSQVRLVSFEVEKLNLDVIR